MTIGPSRWVALLVVAATLALGEPLHAQDATIINARLIVGNGQVIDRGFVSIRDGRIEAVGAGAPRAVRGTVVDALGMSAMPGFIDAHKHVNTGPDEAEQMQDLLEAGYTTVLSGGGPAEGNLELREHIEAGLINGPRIIPSGSLRLANQTAESARAEIRRMADLGIKFTGEIALTPVPGPSEQELEILRALLDEAERVGVIVQVHAVSTPAMMAAVDAGVPLLVHLPNKDWTSLDDARRVAAAGTMVLATIGFGAPVFGVFADDNEPRFRDGRPWPESIVDGVRLGEEAGYMPVNARTLFDSGVVLGYCTDTRYEATAGLEHELKSFNMMFSMRDMVQIMGPNTAAYIQMADELGTLEAGKLADIVLLDGDPLEGYWNWLKAVVVLKGGRIVVDKR